MRLFFLLPLLIAVPSPLFASDSTDGYKKMDSCINNEKHYLAKKENSNSKKWGTYTCPLDADCWNKDGGIWMYKGVSYDDANSDYEFRCGN